MGILLEVTQNQQRVARAKKSKVRGDSRENHKS